MEVMYSVVMAVVVVVEVVVVVVTTTIVEAVGMNGVVMIVVW